MDRKLEEEFGVEAIGMCVGGELAGRVGRTRKVFVRLLKPEPEMGWVRVCDSARGLRGSELGSCSLVPHYNHPYTRRAPFYW